MYDCKDIRVGPRNVLCAITSVISSVLSSHRFDVVERVVLARNRRFFQPLPIYIYLSSISRTTVIIVLNAIRRPERIMRGPRLSHRHNINERFRDSLESPRCDRRSYYFTELNRRKSFSLLRSHSHCHSFAEMTHIFLFLSFTRSLILTSPFSSLLNTLYDGVYKKNLKLLSLEL